MKSLLVLPLFLLGELTLLAQDQPTSSFVENIRNQNQQIIEHLLTNQGRSGQIANKPTETRQRVIAQFSNDQTTTLDSTIYRYSGQMGSEYNYNKKEYTYGRYYPVYYNVSNNGNTVMDVMADTIIRVHDFDFLDFSIGSIRPDSQLDTVVDFTRMAQDELHKNYILNNYNAQGNNMKSVYLSKYSNNGTLTVDTLLVSTCTYGSNSKLITDSTIQQNGDYYLRRYHYNSQDLMDTMYIHYSFSPTPGFTAIEYNNLGFVQKFFWGLNDGSSTSVDSFGYTGNSPNYTFRQSSWGSGANAGSNRVVKYIGANSMIDSTQHFYSNSGNWEVYYAYHYYYNAFNNPDSIIGGDYLQNSHSESRFYYETYDYTPPPPPLSIQDAASDDGLSIYPNPFDDRLYIKSRNRAIRHVQISLLNLLGQKTYTTDRILVDGINTLNIPKIKRGYYVVLIQDEKGNATKKTLVKQ